jgi:hypothetical protein
MKKKAQFYISLLFLVAILSSCKDEPIQPIDILPPATNEGKNTFGCLIDGEAFIGNAGWPAFDVSATFNTDSKRFALQGATRSKNDNLSQIGFIFYLSEGPGSYGFDIVGDTQSSYINYDSNVSCSIYYHNPDNPGSVIVTHLDTFNRIASGTFEMDLINNSCDKTLMLVRDGRFDVNY